MAIINTRPIKTKPSPQTFALDKLLLPKPPKFKLYQNSIVRQSTSTYYRKYSYFANQLCDYKDEEKKRRDNFFPNEKKLCLWEKVFVTLNDLELSYEEYRFKRQKHGLSGRFSSLLFHFHQNKEWKNNGHMILS
jgi:hypothetical protein